MRRIHYESGDGVSNNNIDFSFLADEVLKRLDILEVAEQEGLSLQKKGKNYFGHCPFHSERTPSFSINPKKQIYKCFSCGNGGNVINLLATLRGVNKGKIIYQYAKILGLIDNGRMSTQQRKEIEQRVVKYEFKKKEESNFDNVYRFLCDQVNAFRKAMRIAVNLEERDALQDYYKIYDRLPYYQGLLVEMLGDLGQNAQIEAYLKGEELMNEWKCRISN
jgi:hypothetical protein